MEFALQQVRTPRLQAAGLTHAGCVRDSNEDSILCAPCAFIVADGMGGHAGGEVASSILVRHLAALSAHPSASAEAVIEAVHQAASEISALAAGDSRGAPGTTMSGLFVMDDLFDPVFESQVEVVSIPSGEVTLMDAPPTGQGLLVVNIGDSRTYLYRQGALQQVTRDHSAVQEMLDYGMISPEEAESSVRKSVITRAIGAGLGDQPAIDSWVYPCHSGDRFLVCSDGLSGELSDDVFEKALQANFSDPARTVQELGEQCLQAGAHDNFSLIVVDVVS